MSRHSFYGDLSMHTASLCCESCGMPFETARHGVAVRGDGFVTYRGAEVKLTLSLAAVLRALLARFGSAVHRDVIYNRVWGDRGDSDGPDIKGLDVAVWRLRKRIAPLGLYVKTEYGIGYALHAAEPQNNAVLSVEREELCRTQPV